MNMNKRELVELNGIFEALAVTGKTKFKYLMLKNMEMLKPSISILKTLESDIKKGIEDFDKERNELIVRLGTPGENNTVFIDRNNAEVVQEFNEELAKLVKEHRETLDIYELKYEELQNILEESVEDIFSFRQISIDDFPEEGISEYHLKLLAKADILID